jgi:acetoin utilization deacetylase AcuC-like enzyme/ankyrin repeat protein
LLANREANPPQAFSGGKNLNSLDITLNHNSAEGFKWNGSESISITREDLTQNGHRIISKDLAIAVQIDSYNKREGDIKTEDVNPEILHIQNSSDTKEKNIKTKFSCPYDLDERDDDENTPLHVAIHARKIENVRVLLEAGATVHKKCDGSAPIHLAICLGAIPANAEFAEKCVYLLREYNADLTMRDDSFHTPLYLACVSNLCPVVELLLNDPLSKDTLNFKADRTGGRALHAAAKCDAARRGAGGCVTKLLLAAENIQIDAQNNYGRTPLHIAASRGNWHVARLLINAGADAHILDKRGLSPGSRARKRGMVIPNDLKILGNDAPTRDLIMDPDGVTLLLCHELCIQHRTCPPIVRDDADASEPPPENVRRLNVLINDDDGILRCGEFSACKWNTDARRAALSDVLKVHEYPYIERMSKLCSATPDHPRAIQTLDADTTVSHWSFEAALRAAGSVCEAVDRVVSGDFRNAFCAIRPPGHHAGPRGIVTCPNDPDGSHGFCLLNNIAIGAAYARSMYRNDGIKKIAIIDFDVHHGNGTEEIVRQLTPNIEHAIIRTPFAVGGIQTSTYKPWLDESDVNEVFFASTHGYGPRDSKVPLGGIPGGWFYPASGKTYKSKSLTDSQDLETPNLSDFLMSQTWARLGEDYRNNCCKIIDIGLSLPAKDDTYNHGLQRLELRDAYRNSIIPALMEFDPDLIFISAGFDAHRKDTMNFGYVGMIEEDYEWLTEQIVKVANSCCNGRVVSALEGGYKIHGGIISPFARSVASHVRALVDGGNSREEYDMDEGEWESRFERHMNEEKEKKRQMKMDRHYRSAEGITPDNDLKLGDIGEIRNNYDEDHLGNSRKRSRKQVDYKQLFEQMKKEGN